jgi:ABC-type dipeptide/oligopeptide/nickel transport system permease subunit
MDVVLAFPVLLLALGLGAACSLKGCLSANSVGRDLLIAGAVIMLVPVLFTAISHARGRQGFRGIAGPDWVLRLAPGGIVFVVGLILSLAIGSSTTLIEPGLPVVIFVITLAGWPYMARIIRGQVLSIREKEFVEAARSLGASDTRIIFRHILPNLVAPIIVYTTLLIPTNILFEAALSFLGVGVQPPTASWGAMIADAIEIFDTAWWYMTFPGVALLLTVLAFNLIGDGLQDALNPRTGR